MLPSSTRFSNTIGPEATHRPTFFKLYIATVALFYVSPITNKYVRLVLAIDNHSNQMGEADDFHFFDHEVLYTACP